MAAPGRPCPCAAPRHARATVPGRNRNSDRTSRRMPAPRYRFRTADLQTGRCSRSDSMTATVAGRLQTLRHWTGRTMTLPSSLPRAACTAANIPGPTTSPPSAVLQVMQTLTITGPPGASVPALSINIESAGVSSASSRSIICSHQGFYSRELCWVAPMAFTTNSLTSGAPRPDDASKAQLVMAGLLARESLPSAAFPGHPSGIGEGSSLTVAGAAPALRVLRSRSLAPASLFTFHGEGPSQRTLSAGVPGVNRAEGGVDLMARVCFS